MRGEDVVGCPTGDAIRDMVRARRELKRTDMSSLGLYGQLPSVIIVIEGEGTLLAALCAMNMTEVHVEGMEIWSPLDQRASDMLEAQWNSSLFNTSQHPAQTFVFHESSSAASDVSLGTLDLELEKPRWVDFNQHSRRPPRFLRKWKL